MTSELTLTQTVSSQRPRKRQRTASDVTPEHVEPPPPSTLHPHHPYRHHPIDFHQLAQQYTELHQYVVRRGDTAVGYKWQSTDALHALTRVLFQHYHHIAHWSMHTKHLCPPLTQRINYLCWLQHDLLCVPDGQTETVRGIDIGCGASLVFCLLANSLYQHHMTGIDISIESVNNSQLLVEQNKLQDCIDVQYNGKADTILTGVLLPHSHYHYTICNPPFFDTLDDAQQNTHRANSATPGELVCPGGEQQFIQQHITESVQYQDRIDWFTSMCGKKTTLKHVLKQLRLLAGVKCVRQYEMMQGKQARWAVAWTFQQHCVDRLREHITINKTVKSESSRTVQFSVPTTATIAQSAQLLHDAMHAKIHTVESDAREVHCVSDSTELYVYEVVYRVVPSSPDIQFKASVQVSQMNKHMVVVLTCKPVASDSETFAVHCFHKLVTQVKKQLMG